MNNKCLLNEWALKPWRNHGSLTCKTELIIQDGIATAWETIKHYSNFYHYLSDMSTNFLFPIFSFTFTVEDSWHLRTLGKRYQLPNKVPMPIHVPVCCFSSFVLISHCFAVTCHILCTCILTQKHKRKPSRSETHTQKGKRNLICGF